MLIAEEQRKRFWSKVDRRGDDDCWEWTGSRNAKGYGRFSIKHVGYPVTRIAWAMHHNADFPHGKIACHTCDNPPCCNPKHIWPGTIQENKDDCVAKGRSRHQRCIPPGANTCTNGHPRTDENIMWVSGKRRCRVCRNAWEAARAPRDRSDRYRRQKARALTQSEGVSA